MDNAAEEELARLETLQAMAVKYELPVQRLKPCVAFMLAEGVPNGGYIDPNTACFIIAVQLRQFELAEEVALEKCCRWQADTGTPLKSYGEIAKTVRSAYRSEADYGCRTDGDLYNSGYCLGHKACPYHNQLGGKHKADELDFFKYGWPQVLSARAYRVYVGVMMLERERRSPGGRTYVSYRDLNRWSGVAIGKIKRALNELAKEGLLRFTPGKQGGRHGRATEIRRTWPIPEARRRLDL